MKQSRDTYARLPFRHDRMHRAHSTGGVLAFLDIADKATNVETVAGYLREIPLDVIGRADWVLARWGSENQGWPSAHEAAERLQELLGDIGSNANLGVVPFQIATKPSIIWSSSTPESTFNHDPILLARARAVEVEAFLMWGQALWHPDSYHYVLPSGKHTASFIRLADAFQDLRAAAALSTWLYQALDSDAPTTIVMDIGTLMPLVSELQMASERYRSEIVDSSAKVGSVIALDRYPANALGLQRSLLSASPDSPMLGLVSVSDSGGFAERLLSAFSALGAPSVRIEQLISRQHPGATALDSESERLATIEDPWLSLNEVERSESTDSPCSLCKNPNKARLVRINPRGMSAMILPEPDLIVPDIFDARRNAAIWEVYSTTNEQANAVCLLGPTKTRLPPQHERAIQETTYFEPAQLLMQSPSDTISKRLSEFDNFPKRNREDNARKLIQNAQNLVAEQASIVIYEEQERSLLDNEKWQELHHTLAEHNFTTEPSTWIGYTTDDGLDLPTDPPDDDGLGVLVLALGSKTGLSCQRMFLAGRQQWPNASFRGLVVHAHPEDERIWTSIRNTFTDSNGNKRLLALWLTYMPNWSPLAVERDTYFAAQQRGLDTLELSARLGELQAGPLPGQSLLGRANPRLQPHSYFGQTLGSRETLCAVGAAMQSARIQAKPRGAPYWTQFDLRRILRSYFDGLIHACILRWCEPQEVWWGPNSNDCSDFLLELEGVDFDFNLLLPELLLAGAQEKLPQKATAQLIETAKMRLEDQLDDRTRQHVKLGIDLCELALLINN